MSLVWVYSTYCGNIWIVHVAIAIVCNKTETSREDDTCSCRMCLTYTRTI